MDSGRHVVVGAAGATGRRVVRRLVGAGLPVTAVTRDGRSVGTPGVDLVAGDARDAEAMRRVTASAAVVYHCVMPPLTRWWSEFAATTDALIDAATAHGARLVYADSTWMYGRTDGPMTSQTTIRPVSAKGVLRAFMAERILHAADVGRIRASIVRAGELYGPGVRSMIAGNVFDAVAHHRTATWFGDADQPITPTFIDDFAGTVATVGLSDRENAAVWHVPHPVPTTGRGLVVEACRQVGTRPRVREIGPRLLRTLGVVVPLAREAADLVYQFEQPFVVDGAPTAATFGVIPTPLASAVAACLAAAGAPIRPAEVDAPPTTVHVGPPSTRSTR
jgi:nucleoside-diphosphate-sugar epimerase